MKVVSPIGLIGKFIPTGEEQAWSEYVNQNCVITSASFVGRDGELDVMFNDETILTIQAEEFEMY